MYLQRSHRSSGVTAGRYRALFFDVPQIFNDPTSFDRPFYSRGLRIQILPGCILDARHAAKPQPDIRQHQSALTAAIEFVLVAIITDEIRLRRGGFGSTERRRSRTDRAVGCTTARVLKTRWATGPMPLRRAA